MKFKTCPYDMEHMSPWGLSTSSWIENQYNCFRGSHGDASCTDLCEHMNESIDVEGHPGQHSEARCQLLLQVSDVRLQQRLDDAAQATHDACMLCNDM